MRQAVGEGLAGLVLDDLQFADAASVEIVQQLAEAGTGMRWIVAFRPGELTPAAQRFHDELLGAHGARLCLLQPLATPQIVDLIDSLGVAELEAARLAPALARHSGGNPLFLLETMKLLLTPQGQTRGRSSPSARACRRRPASAGSSPAASAGCRPRPYGWRAAPRSPASTSARSWPPTCSACARST